MTQRVGVLALVLLLVVLYSSPWWLPLAYAVAALLASLVASWWLQ